MELIFRVNIVMIVDVNKAPEAAAFKGDTNFLAILPGS